MLVQCVPAEHTVEQGQGQTSPKAVAPVGLAQASTGRTGIEITLAQSHTYVHGATVQGRSPITTNQVRRLDRKAISVDRRRSVAGVVAVGFKAIIADLDRK